MRRVRLLRYLLLQLSGASRAAPEIGDYVMASPTGAAVREAEFDPRVMGYVRALVSLIMLITVVGIPFIPFWLLFSISYAPKAFDRLSARLPTRALEVRMGVYFRKESTIPLDRITDIRLHDDPLMRMYGLRGIRVETAGQAGSSASAEGNLIGIIDAVEFRDAILRERDKITETPTAAPPPSSGAGGDQSLLVEIRDLLQSIDAKAGR